MNSLPSGKKVTETVPKKIGRGEYFLILNPYNVA
jgi:hypothetical protein